MDKIIEVKNLSFSYEDKKVFENLNFSIDRGTWVTILGKGKTTLVKLLSGLLPSSNITINKLPFTDENRKEIRTLIGVVLENPNYQFIGDTVMDVLAFGLENLQYDREDILESVGEISYLLKIENLLSKSIEDLSGGEKELVVLASVLVMRPRILILDSAFSMLDNLEKEKLMKTLTTLHKKEGLTILNFTNDIEESIYGEEILLLNQKVLIHDTKETVYKEEKLLKEYGLPFMVSLSKKLSYYHLLNETIYDMEDMVDYLWK